MSKKKKVVIIIVSVFLAIVLIASLGKGKNNKKNKSPVNTPIVTKAETPSIDDGDAPAEEYPNTTNDFVKKFEIVDASGDLEFNDTTYEITIKLPRIEGFSNSGFRGIWTGISDKYRDEYISIGYQCDDFYCASIYRGREDNLINGDAEFIGCKVWFDGKYQMVDGQAVSHDDMYYYVDTDGSVIMYYDENTNLDSNYYDSNGSLIYQQLYLNGSDKPTWFDANGMERSREYIYDMVLSKYGDKEIINIVYDK